MLSRSISLLLCLQGRFATWLGFDHSRFEILTIWSVCRSAVRLWRLQSLTISYVLVPYVMWPCSETVTHIEIINSDVSGPFASSFLCNQPTFQSIIIQGKQNRISLEGTNLLSFSLGRLVNFRFQSGPDNCARGLPNLKTLQITNAALNDSLVDQFVELPSLVELRLSDNQLASYPSSLCSFTNLERLELQRNNFSAAPPPCLANLTKLTYLDLSSNKIAGSVPKWLPSFPNLTTFSMADNALRGEIPDIFDRIPTLERLDLSWNLFCATIPSSLWLAPNLISVSLNHAGLYGTIPSSIAHLALSIRVIELEENALWGPLPQRWSFPVPRQLKLRTNLMSGQVPSQLRSFIDAEDNSMSGCLVPANPAGCLTLKQWRSSLCYCDFFAGIPIGCSSVCADQPLFPAGAAQNRSLDRIDHALVVEGSLNLSSPMISVDLTKIDPRDLFPLIRIYDQLCLAETTISLSTSIHADHLGFSFIFASMMGGYCNNFRFAEITSRMVARPDCAKSTNVTYHSNAIILNIGEELTFCASLVVYPKIFINGSIHITGSVILVKNRTDVIVDPGSAVSLGGNSSDPLIWTSGCASFGGELNLYLPYRSTLRPLYLIIFDGGYCGGGNSTFSNVSVITEVPNRPECNVTTDLHVEYGLRSLMITFHEERAACSQRENTILEQEKQDGSTYGVVFAAVVGAAVIGMLVAGAFIVALRRYCIPSYRSAYDLRQDIARRCQAVILSRQASELTAQPPTTPTLGKTS
jgi:hypothetical protein